MHEHTHIHFIHALSAFLMVVWFFILLTLIMAKWPDNAFVHVLRQTIPHGDAADSGSSSSSSGMAA
jgi:hypothetical protein